MSTIRFGSAAAISLDEASESWITEQVDRRRHDRQTSCVAVQIDEPGVRVTLASPHCGTGGGGGRPPFDLPPALRNRDYGS